MYKDDEWSLEFISYIREGESDLAGRAETWETAIGLQDVDGLKPSKYLIETAKEHIEGNINLKEVETRINDYYKVLNGRNVEEINNTEEADKVSVRITKILSENSFNFSPTELLNIHKRLFDGIYKEAGKIRDYNFTKKEWILNGDTVIYAPFDTIRLALQYDFELEKNFSYKNLTLEESINHLCHFTSNIWQIHPFCEGNTRTTAVFIIKYLNTFGFNLNNEVFAKNSWYFRNSLVRANYKKFEKNIFEDISFLQKFFYNLLTNTNYKLKNRFTHIDYVKHLSDENINYKNYNLEEQAIINIIKNNKDVKQEEIARSINKSLRTVKTIMRKMQNKGLIARKNGRRNGEWIVL